MAHLIIAKDKTIFTVFIPKSFLANLAKGAAICIVQFHICDFKLWGFQNAVLKSFLVFF